jgi:hypothetical protein
MKFSCFSNFANISCRICSILLPCRSFLSIFLSFVSQLANVRFSFISLGIYVISEGCFLTVLFLLKALFLLLCSSTATLRVLTGLLGKEMCLSQLHLQTENFNLLTIL